MQQVLDALASLQPVPIESLAPADARRRPNSADAVKAVVAGQGRPATPEAVGKVADRMIQGAAGQIPARVYAPAGTGPFPILVYYHGGGWVIGGIDAYDASARALTNTARAIVVSVGYRRAPEHRFPAAHADAYTAYRWVRANAGMLGGDPARIAVGGEGAGGTLAAAVSIMARDSGLTVPVHQLLVYPIADASMATPSYREHAAAQPLSRATMTWYFGQYLRTSEDGANPLISLVRADVKGLPPATIIAAELDPLTSEGRAYAERLEGAGVDVEYELYSGVTHEFFGMGAIVPDARAAVELAASRLRKSFEESARAYEERR